MLASFAFDGLRCVVQSTQRHGSRATDVNGDVGKLTGGWGSPNGPFPGLIAHGGYTPGQTIYWYASYREDPALVCMTGQNTSNGIEVTIVP